MGPTEIFNSFSSWLEFELDSHLWAVQPEPYGGGVLAFAVTATLNQPLVKNNLFSQPHGRTKWVSISVCVGVRFCTSVGVCVFLYLCLSLCVKMRVWLSPSGVIAGSDAVIRPVGIIIGETVLWQNYLPPSWLLLETQMFQVSKLIFDKDDWSKQPVSYI